MRWLLLSLCLAGCGLPDKASQEIKTKTAECDRRCGGNFHIGCAFGLFHWVCDCQCLR